ncbi:MAG: F0F1 ATP synthase subunit A [Phycisphaerae bacterium]|nr:F0F1 ATP synthase subunit A [Phycisphaerae bacterium]
MDFLLAADNPLTHVVQHPVVQIPLGGPGPFFETFTLLSNHIIMQIIAAVLLIWLIPKAVKMRRGTDDVNKLVPRGFGNLIEGLCDALRTHVAQPALGKYTDQFVPYVWSAFFFVLTCNLVGLIPLADWTKSFVPHHALGGTSTGNVWVTGTLAVCTLFMIIYNGLRLHGVAYVKHFFIGPPGLNVFIAFLEVVGLAAKTFALAVRLFANMLAGHILLAVLAGFVMMTAAAYGTLPALALAIPVILGSVAINFLELFVAFLQAFIFTFLTATFIGMAINIHHDEHDEEHAEAAAAH